MKKLILTLLISILGVNLSLAQLITNAYYDVVAANGNGVRFWQGDNWKIHMGNLSEYHYGPVTDYSIKMNMDATSGRGWTWGQPGVTPIAAISNAGNMQIAGTFTSNNLKAWAGNDNIGTGSTQLQLSWGGGNGSISYAHAIKSRHNGGSLVGNSIDFYLWQPGDNTNGEGSLHAMSLNGGKVGVGTTAPEQKLDVRGNLLLETGSNPLLYTGTGPSELNRYLSLLNSPDVSSASGLKAGGVLVSDSYAYANPGKNDLIVKGSVGIGTTNPGSYKLAVEGKIGAREVNVIATNPWPDYVFEKNYKLTSLEEIKNYIDQNQHLPEVPSAKEVEKNGVNLGEMNALLLKKIEELTLYVIELKKENEALHEQTSAIKKLQEDIQSIKTVLGRTK